MPEATRTVVIDRPVDDVFAFFTDHGNDPTWRPLVIEIAPPHPVGVGSVIRQTVKGPGGRGIPSDIEITAYEPPTRYAFRVIQGPVRPVGVFRFASSGAGTEVTLTLSAELGGLKKLLLTRPVQSSMNSEVAGLDRAKNVLESA